MKKAFNTRSCILWIAFFWGTATNSFAQDSSVAEPTVTLRYFANNNSVQYLLVQSSIKEGKKFKPLPKQAVHVYLDTNTVENRIIKTITNEKGLAKVIIPPSLKDKWNSRAKHQFIGVMEATSKEEEITTTLEITRAKIEIDTSNENGTRLINVKVMFFDNNDWLPATDVEMKVGVDRSGAILSAGDEETYTTDSTGTVSVEFKKDSLPGDQKGNFVLVAKVEDNDQFGNQLIEKIVPWGVALEETKDFFEQRTLWSTRFRTPLWLLFIAYAIVIAVWGTIIFLVLQIFKIKKLGAAA